jgi:amino acid adenylation domain-containing protein
MKRESEMGKTLIDGLKAVEREQLLKLARSLSLETKLPVMSPITHSERGGRLLLSFAQQRLWLLAQMEGASEAYHIPLGLSLKGDLDRAALRRALDRILARHEALRTTFALIDGEPVQRITAVEGSRFLLIEHDLRFHNNAKTELDRLTELEASASFDLEAGPLIRGRLIRISEDEHVLLITMHHIVSDGWSMGPLIKELSTLYGAFLRGEDDPLPDLDIQYADYAVWQRHWIEGDILKQQAAYWKTALAGAPVLLELPTDHPRPPEQSYSGAYAELVLDEKLTAGLKDLSRRHDVTLFMTLLAAWAALLARLSGQQDVLVGTPTANRGRAEIEKLIGFFVNTLVVRLDLSGSLTVSELLEQAKAQALAAQQYQDIPFEQVVELARPVRSMAHNPLFQVMFAWQGSAQGRLELPGLDVQSLQSPHKVAKFDLTLDLREAGNTISGGIEYATALFEKATIERYMGYFRTLLEAMVADDAQAVDRLSMLSDAERQQLLADWNNTVAEYPKDVPLAQLVEEQVERTPDAVAVVYGEQRLTYRDLNARANQLAHELLKQGAGPDQIVGLYVARSTDLIVALLAIVKTGAAYLPLDPLFPAERLGYMLEDSGARLLVTQQSLRRELPAFAGAIILLEDEDWQANPSDNPAIVVRPEHLAYVIYTSGSTGKPKGVQVPRGALTNLLWSMREWLQLNDLDRLLAVTTISFDIAAADVWLPLLVGAHTVVASHESAADGNALRDLLERHNITFLQATPVTWRLLFDAGWRGKPELQAVCTGEAMPPEVAAQLVPVVKRVWNLYGPTETTIWSTGYLVTDAQKPILIGRPVANTQCYILDGQGQPVPIGVTGELYIGGDGLARGYLNRPELTAEKFVADPFRGGEARMYRTGDLARYRADGNIECLGRVDHQVKIRGYRIELGEIEAVLKGQPEIKQAVVIVREDTPGDKRLVAYYTASPIGETEKGMIGAEQLRAHLSASLPEYMVPAAYVRLESLPLTPNGKLDRKALPAPEADSYSTRGYEPPQGEMEMELAAIWARVLKLDRVGRHDNFFDLGGHSLIAVQVVTRLRQVLSRAVEMQDLFAHPELAEMASALESAAHVVLQPITRAARKRQPLPLSLSVSAAPESDGHGIGSGGDGVTRNEL